MSKPTWTDQIDAGVELQTSKLVSELLKHADAKVFTPELFRNARVLMREAADVLSRLQNSQGETPVSTDELLDNCALRGELELTVEHLEQANSACEAASKRLDEMTAHIHSIRQFAWILYGSDGDGGGLLELGFQTAGEARAAHDALIAIPAPKTSLTGLAPAAPSPSHNPMGSALSPDSAAGAIRYTINKEPQ